MLMLDNDVAMRDATGDSIGLPSRYRLTPNLRAEAAERRRLTRDLETAVREDTLRLHYNPRLALDSGDVLGAEAMIRWPHHRRGLISPKVFLPLAERGGLLAEISAWTLTAACREAMTWPVACVVSVQVATFRLAPEELLAQVAGALEQSGLPSDRLELSFPEAVLSEPDDDTYLTLSALRDIGVGVALDDFGVGVASLAMLKRLPLTALKLDRALVRDIPASREDATIARVTIETAQALGLATVADGVETEAQRAFLSGVGCALGQGSLFGPSLATERVGERMAAQMVRHARRGL
jgi:EAL domain-containing protein (putative c-di-GMP-specific phosphodiesterase class I)